MADNVSTGVGVTPLPVKATENAVFEAFVGMRSEADFAPAEAGVKVIPMVQLPFCASGAEQVLELMTKPCVDEDKLAALGNERVPLPVFVTLTKRGPLGVPVPTLPKPTEVGDTSSTGNGAAAIPLSVTLAAPVVALLLMRRAAVSVPGEVFGLKRTLMEQLLPAASVALQVLEKLNEVAFVPSSVKLVRFSVLVPEFLKVTDLAALVAPSAVLAKASDVEFRVIACAFVIVAKNNPHATTMQRSTQRVAICLSE